MSHRVTLTAQQLADLTSGKSFTAGAGVSLGSVGGLVPFNLLGQQNAKVSKGSVHYRSADPEHFKRRCGTCSMFRAGRSCTAVEGVILPVAVCDLWEPKSTKAAKGEPYVAGLMVRAEDTGRVLMLQRAITENDPAAGLWEPAGGHAETGESLPMAAAREWSEETGKRLPRGHLSGSWDSADGIYRGFVYDIPSEDDLDIFEGRDQVINPDGDPHGDVVEALAWWDPGQFRDNLSLRPEMQRDLPLVLAALEGGDHTTGNSSKSAETPVVSTVHHPLGTHGLWRTPSRRIPEKQQLPARSLTSRTLPPL